MTDHRHNGTLEPKRIPGENSEQHKSKVTDAGVSDQALEIRLRVRHDRTVNDPNRGQSESYGSEIRNGVGKQRNNKADQAVSPCF